MIKIQESENPSRGINVQTENGVSTEILHMGASLRPGGGWSVNLDIFETAQVKENLDICQKEVAAFLESVFNRAATMGLPVPPNTKGA